MVTSDNAKQIRLSDRIAVETLRHTYGWELSSHAFLSMYLWQKTFGLSLYLENEGYTAKIQNAGTNTWFFPCGSEEAVLRFLQKHQDEADFQLRYLREQDVCFLQEHFGAAFCVARDVGASEYIYSREEHETLRGKAYANVRTQLHKIEREHELAVESITPDNLSECVSVLRGWENLRMEEWSEDALNADLTGLLHMEELGIDGILIRVDGEPAGVAAGYPLTEDTYDLFLAKTCKPLQGLGYYVQRSFFLSRPSGVLWINMEEDLDIEGLRNMKKRLSPVRMNELWRADRIK